MNTPFLKQDWAFFEKLLKFCIEIRKSRSAAKCVKNGEISQICLYWTEFWYSSKKIWQFFNWEKVAIMQLLYGEIRWSCYITVVCWEVILETCCCVLTNNSLCYTLELHLSILNQALGKVTIKIFRKKFLFPIAWDKTVVEYSQKGILFHFFCRTQFEQSWKAENILMIARSVVFFLLDIHLQSCVTTSPLISTDQTELLLHRYWRILWFLGIIMAYH